MLKTYLSCHTFNWPQEDDIWTQNSKYLHTNPIVKGSKLLPENMCQGNETNLFSCFSGMWQTLLEGLQKCHIKLVPFLIKNWEIKINQIGSKTLLYGKFPWFSGSIQYLCNWITGSLSISLSLPAQPEFTCSKLTVETLEQSVNYVQR